MQAGLGRIILYTKRIDEMVAFYTVLFGYTRQDAPGDRIVELRPSTAEHTNPAAPGRPQPETGAGLRETGL